MLKCYCQMVEVFNTFCKKYIKCYHIITVVKYSEVKPLIYRTIISPVVLYGRETWSLTLRDERRLRVFENRAPRRVLGLRGTR